MESVGFPRLAFGSSSRICSSGILGDINAPRHPRRHVLSIKWPWVACYGGNNIEGPLPSRDLLSALLENSIRPPLTLCPFSGCPRVAGILARHWGLPCCIASDVYHHG